MTINEITHNQATKLAAFIHELRPDWDEPGILNAVAKARTRADRADLAIAAIRAAVTATNRTPAIISLDGPHWRGPSEPRAPLPHLERCDRCHLRHMPDTACGDGAGAEPTSDYVEAKRKILEGR